MLLEKSPTVGTPVLRRKPLPRGPLFRFPMNAGNTSLVLSIGNPKVNKCGFYATLKLEDGTMLYESELIKPGYGMTEVPLNKPLEKGNYTAMVVYKCVTLDKEHTPLNSAESEFKLIVK